MLRNFKVATKRHKKHKRIRPNVPFLGLLCLLWPLNWFQAVSSVQSVVKKLCMKLSVVLAPVFLLLAGCGGSAGDDRTIVYNCAANTAEIAGLKPAQEKFFARTGIRVKLNPFSGEEKLYAMIAAGQAGQSGKTDSFLFFDGFTDSGFYGR